NGHIGFNEPGSSLGSLTRIKTLTVNTRRDNARFFNNNIDEVPKLAITMGIGSVMKAQKVVLMANGANKADAVKAALEGPVTAMCPASALQLHRFADFVVTEDAATKLTLPVEK
ncbi:MAG: glucosamine-6-phosphate deaminase, partial [Planctomycetes bacterium]|nr:glucosamine-6-phosphate deaminase [Planctomycetota bacterium]